MRPSFARLLRTTMSLSNHTTRRTYADAIDCLNSLQSNAAVIEAIRLSGGKDGPIKEIESVECLRRIGYEVSARVDEQMSFPSILSDTC